MGFPCERHSYQIRYFDDFLFIGTPGTRLAQEYLDGALQVLDFFSFPV